MERGTKPAKTNIGAVPPVARKSRKIDSSTRREGSPRLVEALEQQAATSEILRVISSSRADVQPVFDTIAANALRLCDARFSTVFRFDGELIHIAAFRNRNSPRDRGLSRCIPLPTGPRWQHPARPF